MEQIKNFILNILPKINLEDDESRVHTQFIVIFFVLSLVSSFMTFLNYLTHWNNLAILTIVLAVTNLVCLIIELYSKTRALRMAGRTIFAAMVVGVFTMFGVVGEPEGFSILWSLLLPSCGFFLFRRKYGFIISFAQLIIIVYLFYFDSGRALLQYTYTSTFLQRFPVIYISFFVVGYIFELVRYNTQKELVKTKEEFKRLYNHDMLTGLYNRYGFNATFDEFMKERNGHQFAFAILDLDHFKNINDKYGHPCGDIVLKEMAKRLQSSVCEHCAISRWGGEEFSILFRCEHNVYDQCNKLLNTARTVKIDLGVDKVIVPISMGVVFVGKNQDVSIAKVVKQADANLYEAKNNGRNQIVYTEFVA